MLSTSASDHNFGRGWILAAIIITLSKTVLDAVLFAVPEIDAFLEKTEPAKELVRISTLVLWAASIILVLVAAHRTVLRLHGKLDDINYTIDDLLAQQGARVSIIKPRELPEFNKVFGSAARVMAYNPPLSLLTDDQRAHRDLIFKILSTSCAEYRVLAGSELFERLKILRERWSIEHAREKAKLRVAHSRMKFIYFDHSEDLHTTINDWGDLEKDLRGVSFFLVEQPGGRHVALLYLLGEPFVRNFVVPPSAIKISSDAGTPGDQLFQRLSESFQQRWSMLDSGDNQKYSSRSMASLADVVVIKKQVESA